VGIARAAEGRGNVEILIDTRRAEGQLGAADLWFLADRLARHRHAFSGKTNRLALQRSGQMREFLREFFRSVS
jgi:hypothetical protein